MDNLKIIKELVKLRDDLEEDTFLGVTLEGSIIFITSLLLLIMVWLDRYLMGSIVLMYFVILFGILMYYRRRKQRKLERIKRFVKECKK